MHRASLIFYYSSIVYLTFYYGSIVFIIAINSQVAFKLDYQLLQREQQLVILKFSNISSIVEVSAFMTMVHILLTQIINCYWLGIYA